MSFKSLPALVGQAMLLGVVILLVLVFPRHRAPRETPPGFSPYVDANGRIRLPEDVRHRFVHLGSWAVTDPASSARGFHDVYTERESAEAYRRTGRFPDGATLVKEIRALETGPRTTGNPVYWAGAPAVWFVMIKDTKGRFAGNSLWQDGWGWAMYKVDAPQKNAAVSYQTDCQGCHLPAAATDRVYVEGYPTLAK